jgi:uncharacterized protein YbjT (DUF2867 family)
MGRPVVLVTGASGYVGGRLVPALLDHGATVRCLARTPSKLDAAPWRGAVEIVQGEASGDLSVAMRGVDVAVYLIHSIGQGEGWVSREQGDAENFSRAASAAGVRRIVYLGGLGRDDDQLSDHLRSRHEPHWVSWRLHALERKMEPWKPRRRARPRRGIPMS